MEFYNFARINAKNLSALSNLRCHPERSLATSKASCQTESKDPYLSSRDAQFAIVGGGNV